MLYTPISSKQRILAQKSSKLTKKSIRWLVALSSIPYLALSQHLVSHLTLRHLVKFP